MPTFAVTAGLPGRAPEMLAAAGEVRTVAERRAPLARADLLPLCPRRRRRRLHVLRPDQRRIPRRRRALAAQGRLRTTPSATTTSTSPPAKRRSVLVTNTPDAVTQGTANLAFALILATARRLAEADRYVRSGAFERDATLGLPAGWGSCSLHRPGAAPHRRPGPDRTGRAAPPALGFGMCALRTPAARAVEPELAPLLAGPARFELDEGLAQADVISVHTPLTEGDPPPHQRPAHWCCSSPPRSSSTPPAAPIIDEAVLADALAAKTSSTAPASTSSSTSPKVHPRLLTLDNVVLAPAHRLGQNSPLPAKS